MAQLIILVGTAAVIPAVLVYVSTLCVPQMFVFSFPFLLLNVHWGGCLCYMMCVVLTILPICLFCKWSCPKLYLVPFITHINMLTPKHRLLLIYWLEMTRGSNQRCCILKTQPSMHGFNSIRLLLSRKIKPSLNFHHIVALFLDPSKSIYVGNLWDLE